jgi:hypothetical protein
MGLVLEGGFKSGSFYELLRLALARVCRMAGLSLAGINGGTGDQLVASPALSKRRYSSLEIPNLSQNRLWSNSKPPGTMTYWQLCPKLSDDNKEKMLLRGSEVSAALSFPLFLCLLFFLLFECEFFQKLSVSLGVSLVPLQCKIVITFKSDAFARTIFFPFQPFSRGFHFKVVSSVAM